jgi:hypothetical protein
MTCLLIPGKVAMRLLLPPGRTACRLWLMATEDDVRNAALALPGVTERLSWGQPAWFAKSLLARIWEPGVLTVKTGEREALAGTDPETYFWTPHHERSPQLVLVRLDRIDGKLLAELLEDSYRLAGGEHSRRRPPRDR